MKKERTHDRAAGQSQITLSLPTQLKDKITSLAKEDRRNRSNWVVVELEKIVERKLAQKKLRPRTAVPSAVPRSSSLIAAHHGANEPEGEYKTEPRK
jgi:hypothetical protein